MAIKSKAKENFRITDKLFFNLQFFFPMALWPVFRSWPPLMGLRGYINFRHITLGVNPLDEWSARRRDLYLITNNTDKRQTYKFPAGFGHGIPPSERPQTHVLDRAATGIGIYKCITSLTLAHFSNVYASYLTSLQTLKAPGSIVTPNS
jgi:hypothetical protein